MNGRVARELRRVASKERLGKRGYRRLKKAYTRNRACHQPVRGAHGFKR